MPNPGKPDPYEEVLTLLAVHPIKTWACAKAGISRPSFYEKLQQDSDFGRRVATAMADGQGPLIAAVSGKSPERVLSWSDPGMFSLRSERQVEGICTPLLVPVSEDILMEGYRPDGWDEVSDG